MNKSWIITEKYVGWGTATVIAEIKEEAIKKIPNLLFLKGKTFKNELNDIPENLNIKFKDFPSITSAESRILLYNKNNICR